MNEWVTVEILSDPTYRMAAIGLLAVAVMMGAVFVWCIRIKGKNILDRDAYAARLSMEGARFYTMMAASLFLSVPFGYLAKTPASNPDGAIMLGWLCVGVTFIYSAVALAYNFGPSKLMAGLRKIIS